MDFFGQDRDFALDVLDLWTGMKKGATVATKGPPKCPKCQSEVLSWTRDSANRAVCPCGNIDGYFQCKNLCCGWRNVSDLV